jgi:hypothetical protein
MTTNKPHPAATKKAGNAGLFHLRHRSVVYARAFAISPRIRVIIAL